MSNDRYLCFSLGNEEYGIPLLSVKEVIAVPETTPMPFTPNYFMGIMNLRGQVISVVDLRQKFSIKTQGESETAVIICDLNPASVGIVVDSINSVIIPTAEDVSEKPEMQNNKISECITGVYRRDKRLILFLDVNKTLSMDGQIASVKTEKKKAA